MGRITRFAKYALGLLLLAAPAEASFFPPVLSSAGVTASTVAAVIINQPTIANTSFGINNLSTTFYIMNVSTVTQGTPGALGWRIDLTSGAYVVMNTTANFNATPPITGVMIGGIGGNGTFQSFATDTSSRVLVNLIESSFTVLPGTLFLGVDHSTGVQVNTGTRFLGVDNSSGVQVNTGTRFLGVDHSTGVQVNFASPPNMILFQPGSEVIATTTTLQTSQNMIGQTSLGVLNVTGSTLTLGYQNGQSSAPVTVMGFGKSGTDVTDTGNTALRVNVVAGATINSNDVNVATAAINAALPTAANFGAVMGPTGLMQTQRVDVSSNTYVINELIVSSATSFPNPYPNLSSSTAMIDSYGRTVVMAGCPNGSVCLSTSPTTSQAGYAVIVASPASNTFTHLCGCIFRNTSASNVAIDIYNSGNAGNAGTQDIPIEATTLDNRGIWPGMSCGAPVMNTTNGGSQISMKVASAVSSIAGYCQYYQTLTP